MVRRVQYESRVFKRSPFSRFGESCLPFRSSHSALLSAGLFLFRTPAWLAPIDVARFEEGREASAVIIFLMDAREIPSAVDTARYDRDFVIWTEQQAAQLRELRPAGLDWENLAEEIDSLGKRDKRELSGRVQVLMMHLLKWQLQRGLRCGSWSGTILEQRSRLGMLLDDSPSLLRRMREAVGERYPYARRAAVREMGLLSDPFAAECPFTPEQVLDTDYYPD